MDLGNLHFAIHFLWLIPLLLGCAWYCVMERRARLRRFASDERRREELTAGVATNIRVLRLLLMIGAILCVACCLVRPLAGYEDLVHATRGRDVVILLDVSRSMFARDVEPSRLVHAKHLIEDLIHASPGDRFGIVAFSGKALLTCPLTSNPESLRMILEDMNPATVPYGGTNLEAALIGGIEAFRGAEGEHRAMVLVSDGEELQGDHQAIFTVVRKAGIPVFVAGVGDSEVGAFIQLPNGTFVMEDGKRVRTRLNEERLRAFAQVSGGSYLHSTATNPGAEFLTRQIRSLSESTLDATPDRRPIEAYQFPLALAICMLLLRFLLSERRVLAPVMGVVLLICSGSIAHGTEVPNDAVVAQIQAAIEQTPDQHELLRLRYNLATRLLELEQLDTASGMYSRLLSENGLSRELRVSTLRNLGAIQCRLGAEHLEKQPEESADDYSLAVIYFEEALFLEQEPELIKSLAFAHRAQADARERARKKKEEEAKRKQAKQRLEEALRDQQEANKQQNQDAQQTKANQSTTHAKEATDQLKLPALTEHVDQAIVAQAKLEDADKVPDKLAYGQEVVQELEEALEILGVKKAARPPSDDPSSQTPQKAPNKGIAEDKKRKDSLAVLKQMADDERDLKRRLRKKNERMIYGSGEVDKNW